MLDIEKVKTEFLSESYDDYVGLWSLVRRIKLQMDNDNPTRVRELTIALLAELLHKGLIKAGIPRTTGEFEEWRTNPNEIVKRIEKEWDQLVGEPNIGDIVWFTTTEKGDTQIKQRNIPPD